MYYYKFLKKKKLIKQGRIVYYEINVKPVTLELIRDNFSFEYFTIPELKEAFSKNDVDVTYQALKHRVRRLFEKGYLKIRRKTLMPSGRQVGKWYCLSKISDDYLEKFDTFLNRKGYLMKDV